MKRLTMFFASLLFFIFVLVGCASYTVWYRQDGMVPFEHFQTVQNEDERLVFISPVLASNHRQSGLYIITNPEDIPKALDALGDFNFYRPADLDAKLKPFSPVMIKSSRDIPTVDKINHTNISNQDGIAVFSVPSFVNNFFYAYAIIKQDYKWDSNDPTEVFIGILPLPPSSQDVYIAFSESKGDMAISAKLNLPSIKKSYDTTNGLYGQLIGKENQIGFIKIGFKERLELINAKAKADALAAGSEYTVSSAAYTSRQEMRTSSRYVPERSHWEQGQTTRFYDAQGRSIGEARADGRRVVDAPAQIKQENYIVNVPIRNELTFELYMGNVKVGRYTTPVTLTGIEVRLFYKLKYIS